MMSLLLILLASDDIDARRVRIVARALSYEQNLRGRAGEVIRILIVSKPGADEAACTAVFKEFTALAGVRVQGVPLEVRQRALATNEATIGELKASPTQVLYLCPGYGSEIGSLIHYTRKAQVISVGSDRKQIESGTALAVEVDGDKLTLLLNSAAAKAEGTNFSEQLLKVATVIE